VKAVPKPRRAVEGLPDAAMLVEIERTAIEIARLAGAEIVTAIGGVLAVRYKGEQADAANVPRYRDPVSEVDQRVETLLRARIGERFPDHDIIGEEFDERAAGQPYADFVWVVDPIDGTTNFINGFPLFASSVGVLYRGRPVVGAVWCATTHALRPGVYHARSDSPVHFDGSPLELKRNPQVMRRLGGESSLPSNPPPWEIRKTGSAALECAFVASGLLQAARFAPLNIWDVGGGIALVQSAGRAVKVLDAGKWTRFDGFHSGTSKEAPADMRRWRQAVLIGEPAAVEGYTGL
jgi:myo-inositol-1(or 4)-monophosphatase